MILMNSFRRFFVFLYRLRHLPPRPEQNVPWFSSPASVLLPPPVAANIASPVRLLSDHTLLMKEAEAHEEELKKIRERIAELKRQTLRKDYPLADSVPHFVKAIDAFRKRGDRLDREYVHHAISLCFHLQHLLEREGIIPVSRRPSLNDTRDRAQLIDLLFEVYADKIERARTSLPEDDPLRDDLVSFWKRLREMSIEYESLK